MTVFRVRLNCIDHYQATPTKYDPRLRNDAQAPKSSKEPKVPVVRVFGSTETGQKVCAHIHGAFPYLFIEYEGGLSQDEVGDYIHRLRLSIDLALAVSYRKNTYREEPRFVARITLVKGVPFYGFHVGYRYYLKIYMLNPVVMSRLADLLQQGLIMHRHFQPFEAHLQYLLQFMADFNLYGCGYVEASAVSFRAPVPALDDEDESPPVWHTKSISPRLISDHPTLPRSSHCSIEVDICVRHILNRKSIKERPLHHDFLERLHPLPPDMKLVHSMAGLWRDETNRRRRRMGINDPKSSPFPPEVLVPMSADVRQENPPGWIHEDEYRELVDGLMAEEEEDAAAASGESKGPISFSNYVQPDPFGDSVKTVLQSVEDLFPENLMPALGLEEKLVPTQAEKPAPSTMVDEKGILELGGLVDEDFGDLFSDDSDGEVLVRKAEEAEKAVKKNGVETRTPAVPPRLHSRSLTKKHAQKHTGGSTPSHARHVLRTVNGVIPAGVCVSGLQSGKLPHIPLSKNLVAVAKAEGHISKFPSSKRATKVAFEPDRLKRPALGQPEDAVDPKRSRTLLTLNGLSGGAISNARPAEIQHHAPVEVIVHEADSGAVIKPTPSPSLSAKLNIPQTPQLRNGPRSQQLKSVLKGSAVTQSPSQRLNFSVVKDPNDPNTKLRLSQQSSSQRSQDSSIKKQAACDSSPAAAEAQWSMVSSIQSPPSQLSLKPSTGEPSSSIVAAPASQIKLSWDVPVNMLVYTVPPPSAEHVRSTMKDYGLPDAIYQDAFYSKETDVPSRTREYAGKEFRLTSQTLPFLPEFDPTGLSPAAFGLKPNTVPDRAQMERDYERRRRECTIRSWELADPPPTFHEVDRWWRARQTRHEKAGNLGQPSQSASQAPVTPPRDRPYLSQILGPTPRDKHGFKYSQKKKSTSVQHETQYMSTMSLEVHVKTRGKLVPNPEEDELQCVFWCLRSDEHALRSTQAPDSTKAGIVVLVEERDGSSILVAQIRKQVPLSVEVLEESSELDVMVRMVEIVRTFDPDILTGYEVHGTSWGFLMERAKLKYDYNLCEEFSRMKSQSHSKMGKEADRWGFNKTSTIHVTGRHTINVWRAMRGELNLLQYTMENVVWHLLHRRIPHYSWRTLTDWYGSGRPGDLNKVLRYYLTRSRLDIEILEANELVPRISEQARLLGVDFFSVFSRGSQFKVESIMFRIAKPENFMLVSPSRKQVGGQNALECLPLVMEPQSGFYNSPLLVLDFQSLYPSVMIAYNYCYSTFLGRIVNWRGTGKMGFTEYKRRRGLLRLLQDHINIAPNGIMYTKPEIRKSLLAKMLTEILETRVMVKSGMAQDKDDKKLQQLLNNRQLALKLLANVTYGYTSASFSGRMPCSEIADSIVQTGRETLERAIAYIHSVERWQAEVVYGDTDSLFIHLPGRTREEAFDIGAEMAREVTEMNPRPIRLKFEKVYHPCVLLAKKRYVGYKFEHRDQTKPDFDAKGIETVRRDGTPAEQKMEEKALRELFESADLSAIKSYFQAQCTKILKGDVSIQDFCFARETKLGSYANNSADGKGGAPPPPGALISTRRMMEDPRAELQYGERVPYVVVTGAPGARLVDRCVAPEELLASPHGALDAEYYITKNIIPPLERIFGLVGASVQSWYDEMPKVQRVRRVEPVGGLWGRAGGRGGAAGGRTLEWFLRSASCAVCGVRMKVGGGNRKGYGISANDPPICRRCKTDAPASLLRLHSRLNREQKRLADVVSVCRGCSGETGMETGSGAWSAGDGGQDDGGGGVKCDSKDCPVFWTRCKQATKTKVERATVEPVMRRLERIGSGRDLEW